MILIRDAAAIVLMDDARTVLRGRSLAIDGPAIAGFDVRPADVTIDGRGKLVIPGLVNTHHHLFQTLTRAVPRVHDAPLFEWLTTLYEIWAELTPEGGYVAAQVGLGELLLSGCTTSMDHHYLPVPVDHEIRAAAELGIRFHPTRGSMSRGRSAGGLPPDSVVQDEETILTDSERVIETYHDPRSYAMCRVALAPCSPFSVTTELMKRTAELARRRGVRLHTHLAETRDEQEFCLREHGCRPLAYAESCGWNAADVWFAHLVHVTDDEIARLKAGVAHCPTSNQRLNSGTAPVPRMLAAGVTVGLGVDGSASNDSSNMLAEVTQAALVHPLADADALWMATRGGARLLGRDDIGSIEPGKAADLVLIDVERAVGALNDPAGAAARVQPTLIDTVIVNGKIVVRHGGLTTADERAVARRARELSAAMLERARRRTGIDYAAVEP